MQGSWAWSYHSEGLQVRAVGTGVPSEERGTDSTRWVQRMRCSDEKKSCGSSPRQADSASSSTFIFLRTVKIETSPLRVPKAWGWAKPPVCKGLWPSHMPLSIRSAGFSPYLKDSRLLFTTQPSPLSQMFFTRVEANFKSLLKIHVIMIEIVIFELINMYSEFCWTAISVANYYCSFFVYTENRNTISWLCMWFFVFLFCFSISRNEDPK